MAHAAVRAGAPLGIVPRGTANSIAAALGIPGDLEAACDAIAGGATRRVDAAIANGRLMVLLAAVGFHAETVERTLRGAKNRLGALAYVASGIAELAHLPDFQLELETEDKMVRCRATSLTIANAASRRSIFAQGPAEVRPDDGLLDATIVAAGGVLDLVAAGVDLWRSAGREEAATHEGVGFLRFRRARVVTEPVQRVVVDGEPWGTTPLDVEALPAALTILVPRAAEDREPVEKLERLPDLEVEPKPTAA